MLSLVVAMSVPGRVIGRAGGLPWHHPEDLAHFRRVTTGHTIVMGRKTWESIGRPLPGRHSVVLTRTSGYRVPHPEVEVVALPGGAELDALLRRWRDDAEERFVIGGADIFRAALPHAGRLHLTEIHAPVEGDTLFPAFSRAEWREVERRAGATPGLVFTTLERTARPGDRP